MNSVTRRRSAEDVILDGLGYLICLFIGLVFAFVVVLPQTLKQVSREHVKVFLLALTIFAFTPGIFCLFFYVVADVTKVTGVARWMSWWWIWII